MVSQLAIVYRMQKTSYIWLLYKIASYSWLATNDLQAISSASYIHCGGTPNYR